MSVQASVWSLWAKGDAAEAVLRRVMHPWSSGGTSSPAALRLLTRTRFSACAFGTSASTMVAGWMSLATQVGYQSTSSAARIMRRTSVQSALAATAVTPASLKRFAASR